MSADARHQLGRQGEQIAAEHLRRRGFVILDRNFQTRWGELDIVAFGAHALVFCEVKTRRLPLSTGHPLEAIDPRKRARLRKMAGRWLIERRDRPYADDLRFDAIGVTFDGGGRLIEFEHVENAL